MNTEPSSKPKPRAIRPTERKPRKKTPAQGMPTYEIKMLLEKAGLTQTAVARNCGVAYSTVHGVMHHKHTSRHISEYIASKTCKTLYELFPGRYDTQGTANQPE